MNHAELKAKALSNPETLAAYESMDVEFSIFRQMLTAREKAGLSQAQVASRMGTKATAITRLESSLSSGKHSPFLITLRRYAQAVRCELEVQLVKSKNL